MPAGVSPFDFWPHGNAGQINTKIGKYFLKNVFRQPTEWSELMSSALDSSIPKPLI
jgi:hypothetical protein